MFSNKIIPSIVFFCFNALHLFSQTYTFTTAGATGRFGPTQMQLNTAYNLTNLNSLVTTINGIQNFTVPSTGNYRIIAKGAKGGTGIWSDFSAGAKIEGEFSLTAGQVLKILVGQEGGNGTIGGGGGGSFVTDNNNTPLIVAGGGGGSPHLITYTFGLSNIGGNTSTSGMPGSQGNTNMLVSLGGISGNGGGVATTYPSGQGSGGAGFTGNGVAGNPATGGISFLNGGNGGSGASQPGDIGGDGGFGGGGGGDWSDHSGAGGGGGYSGGGGGTYYGLGGGGGSYNSGINQLNSAGTNSASGSVIISNLRVVTISQTASISCHGQLTAALTASADGGVAPYSYTWLPSNVTTQTIIGLGAGTYTCLALDANATPITNTFLITEPAAFVTVPSQTNVPCYGVNHGRALIIASGGLAPYSFTWTPGNQHSNGRNNLFAGNYTCTVQDNNNCFHAHTFTITQPLPLTIFGVASNPTVCAGEPTILIGGGALTYTWNNGVTNAVPFNPTVTKTYDLIGMNASGCIAYSATTIYVNPTPTVSVAGSGSICAGNTITLTANGASTYTWNNSINSPTFTDAPLTLTHYTLSGTNAFGCSAVAIKSVAVLYNSVSANASTVSVCFGNTLTLYGSGATTYTWSHGVTNALAFSPPANDIYTVSATGPCGISSNTINITVHSLPNVIANTNTTSVCAGGTVTLYGSGANNYSWTHSVNNNLPFAPASTIIYTVTGIDLNGCKNTAMKTIAVYSLPNITASASSTIICEGTPVTLNGTGAFTYTWTHGLTNNTPFSPSATTDYTVSGTDLNGCSNKASQLVAVVSVPIVTANTSSAAICSGGSVILYGSGANTYTWSGNITDNIAFAPASSITYTVTGANSCFTATDVVSVTVYTLPVVIANASQSSICLGKTTTLFGTGGTTYTWSAGVIDNLAFSPVSTVVYSVSGTDANGCKNTAIKTISVNPLPVVTASTTNTNFCFGNSTTLNGGGAVTYSWSENVIDNTAFTPSVTLTYTVTGTDANGCENTATQIITVNQLPVISANTSSSVICIGNPVTLSGSGADTYTWTGGVSDAISFSPSSTLSYSVSGTNILTGCSSTNNAIQTITVNLLPTVLVNASNTMICTGSSLTLNGTNADTFNWSGGITDGILFSPLLSETFTVTGSSTLTGCSNTATQHIVVNTLPTLITFVSHSVVCNGASVTVNAVGADTYTWTNSITNNIPFYPNSSGGYSVSGTNTLTGCIGMASQSINVNPLPVVSLSVSSSSICAGNPVTLYGTGANSYTWSQNVTNGISFVPASTANYFVSGTNTLTGCTSTNMAIQTIVVNTLPIITINSSASVICNGDIIILNASGAQNYSWNTNETSSSITISPNLTTLYSVTGTDANNCSAIGLLNQEVSDCLGMSQNQTIEHALTIFPNPNNGEFYISSDVEIDLEILNDLGQLVRKISCNENNQYKVQIGDLANGIYFVLGQKDKRLVKQKVIVAK